MDQSEFIIGHVMLAFSAILPAFLMQFIDTDEPNKLMGYRTKWSMKSNETWKFAQKYSCKMLWYATIVTITIQLFAIFAFETETSLIVAVSVMTVGMLSAIVLTEKQLRVRFNKDGTPKSSSFQDLI